MAPLARPTADSPWLFDARLPNLFLVGAAKSATTALAHDLAAHADIYLSPIKEPHFFSSDIDIDHFRADYVRSLSFDEDTYFRHRQLPPRHIAFVRKPENYLRLYAPGQPRRWRLDASVSYLYSACAASAIAQANPTARILMILRNPVDRAYSHYLTDVEAGFARPGRFVDTLREESGLPRRAWGRESLIIDLGLYAGQIARYLKHFPSAQIHVLRYDDYVRDRSATLNGLRTFLGLEPAAMVEERRVAADRNPTRLSRFPRLKAALKPALNPLNRLTGGHALHNRLAQRWLWRGTLPALTLAERCQALPFFLADILETQRLTGLDLSQWLQV